MTAMDNLDLYLYILIGIIYLVSRALKAKKNVAPPRPPKRMLESTEPTSEAPAPKPFSFEDLLREFERNINPQEQPLDYPEQEEAYSEVDVPTKVTEYESYPGASDYKTHEAKSLEGEAYPMYYQESELAGISMLAERHHQIRRKKRNFGKLLQSPGSLRDAVVLSEVLGKRDY